MKKILLYLFFLISVFHCSGQITFERVDSFEMGSQLFGNDNRSILQTHDNGFLSAGSIVYIAHYYFYWEKLDSSGNYLWSHLFGAAGNTFLYSAEMTTDNGFILCGYVSPSPHPMCLIKVDSNGVMQWQRFIGLPYTDTFGYSAKQTLDGGYIIAGSTYFPGILGPEIIKT